MRPSDIPYTFTLFFRSLGEQTRDDTLDSLRNDLSHEINAKLSRLNAYLVDWERGRYRPEDPSEAWNILQDLQGLLTRHLRRSACTFETWRRLLEIHRVLNLLRHLILPTRRRRTLGRAAIMEIRRRVHNLDRSVKQLTEDICSRYAVRISEIVEGAADEVRREVGGGLSPDSTSILIESEEGSDSFWEMRCTASTWRDIIRNLMRNAVEATEERLSQSSTGKEQETADAKAVHLLPPVHVSLRPSDTSNTLVLEVADDGIGMSPSEKESMWLSGRSRRGAGHGAGLTESKLRFLESRARIQVESTEGYGTTIRLFIPRNAIHLPAPSLWSLRPLRICVTGLLIALLTIAFVVMPRAPELEALQITSSTCIRVMDSRGSTLRVVSTQDRIRPNRPSREAIGAAEDGIRPPVVLRDRKGRCVAATFVTAAEAGDELWIMDSRGSTTVRRSLWWCPPRSHHLGHLISTWQMAIPWGEGDADLLAFEARDNRWHHTSIHFVDPVGRSIGAYYHPGHLQCHGLVDLDKDGRSELLLYGVNNHASFDTTMFSAPPDVYVPCIVLIREPPDSSQAYPYRDWGDMPRAREAAYLLIPPLREEEPATIRGIALGMCHESHETIVEIVTEDGRFYRLDSNLRPLSCTTGDKTPARASKLPHPLGPFLLICDGQAEMISLALGESDGTRLRHPESRP